VGGGHWQGNPFFRGIRTGDFLSVSGDGKWLATGSHDHTARLWDVGTGKEIRSFGGILRVTSVSISADGKWLVTGSYDRTARLWEVNTGKEKSDPTPAIWRRPFTFLCRRCKWWSLAVIHEARLWETATGKEVRAFRKTHAHLVGINPRPCPADGICVTGSGTVLLMRR